MEKTESIAKSGRERDWHGGNEQGEEEEEEKKIGRRKQVVPPLFARRFASTQRGL
jgi:hypothetical protein